MSPDPTPDDLLLGMVDAILARQAVDKSPHRDYKARMPLRVAPLLAEAAAAREMSVSAYLRRAGLAFVAHDLGISLEELLHDEPATRLRTEGPKTNRQEAGEGHGLWKIGGLM